MEKLRAKFALNALQISMRVVNFNKTWYKTSNSFQPKCPALLPRKLLNRKKAKYSSVRLPT